MWGGGLLLRPPPPLSRFLDKYVFKDDVNGFSSTSDSCFTVLNHTKRLPRAYCEISSILTMTGGGEDRRFEILFLFVYISRLNKKNAVCIAEMLPLKLNSESLRVWMPPPLSTLKLTIKYF